MKKHNTDKAMNPNKGTSTNGELYFKSRALSIREYSPEITRMADSTVVIANEYKRIFTYELTTYFSNKYFSNILFIIAPFN